MRKSSKLIGALAIAGIAAAGGTAFTASNTQAASQIVGYGSTMISGATVSSMHYNLSATGDNVDTVTVALVGNTIGSAVSIGFNGGALTPCGTGVFTTVTTYICDNGGASFTQPTDGLSATAVVVN